MHAAESSAARADFREADLPAIEATIRNTLTTLCENGVDRAQIEASLASFEFKLRERDYGTMPRGLVFELEILSSWLYDGDPAARDALITHNLRLVVYLAKKYEGSGVPSEDMVSIGTIGLIKAVNTFTPERSIKLATYASRCIGNEILMYLRKSSNRRQEASIDEPLNIDGDGNELLLSDVLSSEENQVGQRLEQDAERASLRRSVEQLSPRERQIMELRFGLLDGVERTQKEVADAIGISQSYISRLEKRIIRQLREQLGE